MRMLENAGQSENQDAVQEFLRLHTAYQHRIYGFIMSFVADWNKADDIYQETVSVLWRRFGEYTPGTDFLAWAFAIARLQILVQMRKEKVQRKYFSSTTLEHLHEVAMTSAAESESTLRAMRDCIQKLPERSRELLALRYEENATVQKIADRIQQSVHVLYKAYGAIHAQLFRCIRKTMEWD